MEKNVKIKNKIAVIVSSVIIITGIPIVSANATETSTQPNGQNTCDTLLAVEKSAHASDILELKSQLDLINWSLKVDIAALNRYRNLLVKDYNAKAKKYKFATTK